MTARGSSHRRKNRRGKKHHESLLDKIYNDAKNAGARTSRSHAAKVTESRDDEDDEDVEASLASLSYSQGSSSIGLSRFASDSVSCVKSKKVSFDDRFSYISFDAFEASYGDDDTHHVSRFDELTRGRSTVPWWWALGHESVEDSSLMDDEGNSFQRREVSRSPRCQGSSFDDDRDFLIPRTEEPNGHRVESSLSCESWISEIGQEVELDLDEQTECSGDNSGLSIGSLNYQPKKPSRSKDKGGYVYSNADVVQLGAHNHPKSSMNLSKRSGSVNFSKDERSKTSRAKSTPTTSQVENGVRSDDEERRSSEESRKTVAGSRTVLRNGIVVGEEQKDLLNRSMSNKSRLSTISEDGVAESSTTTRSTIPDRKSLTSKPPEESIVAEGSKFSSTTKSDAKPSSAKSTEKSKRALFVQKNLTKLNKLSLKTREESGGNKKQFTSILPESKRSNTVTLMSKSLAANAIRKAPFFGLKKPTLTLSIARNERGSDITDVNRHTSMIQPSEPGHTHNTLSGTSPKIATPIPLDTIGEAPVIIPQVPECTLKTNSTDRILPPTIMNTDDVQRDISPPRVKCPLRSRTVIDNDEQDTGEVEIYFQPTMDFSVIPDATSSEVLKELPTKVAAEQSKTGLALFSGSKTAECLSEKINPNPLVDELRSVIDTDEDIQSIIPETPEAKINLSGVTSSVTAGDNPPPAVATPPKNEPDLTLFSSPTGPDCQSVRRRSNRSTTESTDSTLQVGVAPSSTAMDPLTFESLTPKECPNTVDTSPETLIKPPRENPIARKRSLITSPRALWVKGKSNQVVLHCEQPIPVSTAAGEPFSTLPTSQDNSCLHTSIGPACFLVRNESTLPIIESTLYPAASETTTEKLTTVITSQNVQEKGTQSPFAVPECLSARSTSAVSTKSRRSIPKPVQDSLDVVPSHSISRSGSNLIDTDLDKAHQNESGQANTSPHEVKMEPTLPLQDNENDSLSMLRQTGTSREYILEEVPIQATAGVSESLTHTVTECFALDTIPESQSSSSKSQLSQQSGLNEQEPSHSFESVLTLDWDILDDIKDLKASGFSLLCKQAICQKIDIQCDDHIHVQGAGSDLADIHLAKKNHFGLFCKHPKLERFESHNGDHEFVEGGGASPADERKPRFNIAEAAYEALCHCVGHEPFSDVLANPIKVDDSIGVGNSQEKTRSRQIKKKKRKTKKLLTPTNEEDLFPAAGVLMNCSMKDVQASPHQHCSLSANTERECHPMRRDLVDLRSYHAHAEQSQHVPTKKKTKSFFTSFGRKKKLTGEDEKDVLTLIQSDAFMASIMQEIQLEARVRTGTSDVSCYIEKKSNDNDDFVFPDGFSEMLVKKIAEEAVKKCLEDHNKPRKDEDM